MSNIHEIEGWIDLVQEEIIDPEREIIDPHHHLWHGPEDPPGIKDTYSKGGDYKFLLEKHRLSPEKIAEDIIKIIN